jgi:hypothetical protein
MRDLRNIVVTHRELSANIQVSGRIAVPRIAQSAGQIQPWYHMRENQVAYGTILAAITGYM